MIPKLSCRFAAWAMVLLTFALSKAGVAQMVLYDNFNSQHIDPSKWDGSFLFQDPNSREAVRELSATAGQNEDRRLHLKETTYSATTDDNGGSGSIFGLGFPVPNAITEASFSVVVKDAKTVACGSNPASPVDIGPEFRGRFFSTESSPTSQLGDIEGGIGAYRTPGDVGSAIQVGFHYERCDDDFCSTRTPLDFGVLGYIQPGTTNRFHIKWDQPHHRFVFQLNNGPLVFSPYAVSDSSPPSFAFRAIDIAQQVAHCTSMPRPFASIDAYFDNVRVNP
jgi:hypothetical protein